MGRISKPWFWASAPNGHQGYYVTIDGKRVCLEKTTKAPAMRGGLPIIPGNVQSKFHDAMSRAKAIERADEALAAAIIEAYTDHLEADGRLYKYHRAYFQRFCEFKVGGKSNGRRTINELKRIHLDQFVDSIKKEFAHSTLVQIKQIIKTAFNWAAKSEIISRNPFVAVVVGTSDRSDDFVNESEHLKLMLHGYHLPANSTRGQARRKIEYRKMQLVLTAWYHSGVRPNELCKVLNDPKVIDLENEVWVFAKHKTKGKTGRKKIVHLNKTVRCICRILMRKTKPGQPLFVNRLGTAYKANDIGQRIRRLREKLGLSEDVKARGYRHSLTTSLLEDENFTDTEVAAVMGWSSTAIIHKHYSHVGANRRRLQNKFNAFAR